MSSNKKEDLFKPILNVLRKIKESNCAFALKL